jgi:hypothetical protein
MPPLWPSDAMPLRGSLTPVQGCGVRLPRWHSDTRRAETRCRRTAEMPLGFAKSSRLSSRPRVSASSAGLTGCPVTGAGGKWQVASEASELFRADKSRPMARALCCSKAKGERGPTARRLQTQEGKAKPPRGRERLCARPRTNVRPHPHATCARCPGVAARFQRSTSCVGKRR